MGRVLGQAKELITVECGLDQVIDAVPEDLVPATVVKFPFEDSRREDRAFDGGQPIERLLVLISARIHAFHYGLENRLHHVEGVHVCASEIDTCSGAALTPGS
jgi:hypothetical protein